MDASSGTATGMTTTSDAPNDVEEQATTVGGVQHRWLQRDGGDVPVVLVHGVPTSPELWRDVIPLVTPEATVLAWEMLGYGRSWDVPEELDISVAAQAAYLLEFLEARGIGRAVLVGHDLGGGVVQIAAAHAPKVCAGLVLTNAISRDSWPIPEVKAARATGPVVANMPRPLLREQLAALFRMGHEHDDAAQAALEVHWPNYDHDAGGAVLLRQMRSLDPSDTEAVTELVAKLDVPAAIVWGAADRFQQMEPYGRRLAEDLDTPLDVIVGGLHFTPEDHPDRVAAAVNRVISEVRARSATRAT